MPHTTQKMTYLQTDTFKSMQAELDKVVATIGNVVLGKQHEIRLALACLLSRGHLLIEDIPGVGKTTLAHVLAKSLGLQFSRIQFTSDLLPADILGVSVYEQGSGAFNFHPGPIFAQVVLADEVNRATPKTQSALLEAMEERQVTVEGETRPLPQPFFVIATQNPTFQIGTFPLPESQLDRFLMRLQLGYPNNRAERTLLKGRDRREILDEMTSSFTVEKLAELQQAVDAIHASDALLDYMQAILNFSRQSTDFETGLSPRAGLSLLHCAKAWALLDGRTHLIPEDIQTVLPNVTGHRLRAAADVEDDNGSSLVELLLQVPIP